MKSKLAFAITYIYILFVLWGQYALLDSIFPAIPIALAIIILSAVITKLLLRWCSAWYISKDENTPEKKELKRLALITFGVSFLLLGLGYYSRFPGIYFMDSVYQLNEYFTGVYDDWHPLLQTLLTFALPAKLGGVWLIELLQIIFYCGALTYMICSLRFYGCPKKLCIFILAYLMLQPDTTYILLFPMKDCSFAIITMLLVTEYLHIVKTKGVWLKKNINLVFLIVTLVAGTVIRHNAILFTLPLLAAVLFFSRNLVKRCAVLISTVLLGIVIIKVPLYKSFNISKNEDRVTETMGMCMVMMGNALCTSSEILGDETVNFLCRVQPMEVWEENYTLGDWNFVKGENGGADFEYIEETGRKKLLAYTVDTVLRAPDQSVRAFDAATGMVWQLYGDMNWQRSMEKYDTNYIGSPYDNTPATEKLKQYDIDLPLADYIDDFFDTYKSIMQNSVLRYIFSYIGLLNLIMLVVCMAKLKKNGKLRIIFHALPVFAYSYGTALLLSGYDWRFFYYTYGCFFVIMFIMLSGDNVNERKRTNESE